VFFKVTVEQFVANYKKYSIFVKNCGYFMLNVELSVELEQNLCIQMVNGTARFA
jgi:hypothetical protein